MTLDYAIKWWTVKRKSALAIENIEGKTTEADVTRSFDLSLSVIEGPVEDAMRGMYNSLRVNPVFIREQYDRPSKDLQGAYGDFFFYGAPEFSLGPYGADARQLSRTLHEGLVSGGISVSLTKHYA